MTHLTFTLSAALLLSAALAAIDNRTPRERIHVAAYTFLCCAAGAVAGSWGMYLIHG